MTVDGFSPELRLALALLSTDERRRSPDALRPIVGPRFEWPAFLELVIQRHGIGPFVWRRLRDLDGIDVPQPVRASLDAHYQTNVRRHLLQKAEIVRVQRALLTVGVRPILLKGLAIAERFYEHGGLRKVGDIDLLISLSDSERCGITLSDLGYNRIQPSKPLTGLQAKLFPILTKHFGYRNDHRDAYIELHWRLFDSSFLLGPGFWTDLDGTTQLALSGSFKIQVLATLAEFIHVSVHGAGHAWARLKWLADLSPMIAAMSDDECERILAYGQREGLLNALLLGINLARRLLDVECPPAFADSLHSSKQLEYMTSSSIRAIQRETPFWEQEPSRQIRKIFYDIHIRSSAAYRVSLIPIWLFPPKDWEEHPLPDWLFPLYLFIRPTTWFKRRFK